MTDRPQKIARLGLLIGSLALTLGGFEIGLRLAGYDASAGPRDGRKLILRPAANPEVRYELTPNTRAHAWGTEVAINEHGHRGRTGQPGAFSGVRVLVTGDSITFGNYLPVEVTYASRLHDRLRGSGLRYQVLNFGVGGYDVLQEVAQLEDVAPIYRPDVVVIGFCLNDVGISSPNLEYIERLAERRSEGVFRSRLVQLVGALLDRLRIGSWQDRQNQPEVFATTYAEQIAPIPSNEIELRRHMQAATDQAPSLWYQSELRIGRLRHAFERLSRLAEREDFSVVVLVFPWLTGRAGAYPHEAAHRIVELEARRAGFSVIDLLPSYIAVGMKNLRIRSSDLGHPNAFGHEIASDAVARFLLRRERH